LRSSDVITTDAGKQFVTREFRQYAANMSIEVKTVFVEAHHSIEMIERYHESLRRIYAIIIAEMLIIDFESVLQMSFKTLNDSIESDDLVSTLLVFEAYLRMIESDAFSSTIIQRAIAMRKAMNEIKRFMTIRRVNDAINTRNESSITSIHDLSLNSSILMFRENNIEHSES
jgi:DNA-binding FrmR family transcriptional regulator